ncbi:hypothetical protein BC830DRAFT_1140085 [Chytriomyces sp. MP71]|nr:hypothetical protein BC830DRAFT_1140085 [Chytriomyces sp. MP71]
MKQHRGDTGKKKKSPHPSTNPNASGTISNKIHVLIRTRCWTVASQPGPASRSTRASFVCAPTGRLHF